MAQFTIHHTTTYTYDSPVHDSANQIMLYPVEDKYQEVLAHQLKVTSDPSIDVFKDYYENEVGVFTIRESLTKLTIESIILVNVKKKILPDTSIFLKDQWKQLKYLSTQLPCINFMKQESFKFQKDLQAIIPSTYKEKSTPLEMVKQLTDYVYKNFKYIKGVTTIETTLDEIWELRSGVCQDFAHILLALLRYSEIPSRYVSGYICPNKSGMRGEGATHAWVEAYLPDYGWLGIDPTNNCIVDDTHVKLAVGRNFIDCSPVKGTYKGNAKHSLSVKVSVSYDNEVNLNLSNPTKVTTSDSPVNSYREFVEMQQQQ